MSTPKTQPVQIDASLLASIRRLASDLSSSTGRHTTIRSIVEDALLKAYPDLRTSSAVTSNSMTGDEEQEVFNTIMAAVWSSGDLTEQNAAIERLEGSVLGTYDQSLKLRDLAYHLRGGATAGTLRELVRSYEEKG